MPNAILRPWHEATASLFPLNLSGEVMALRACIDASTQKGVYSVAAVAFGYDRAVKANRDWERLLNGRTFHMTDLHARQGEFEGIHDDEVREIMIGTVNIVREYASFGVAVSCDVELVADALPVVSQKHPDMERLLAAMRSPYGFMCHFAMTALGNRANISAKGRQISYVFERGDEGQRGLKAYLEFLGEEAHHRLWLDGFSLNRLTVAGKKEIEGIFHSADLLAWEWARQVSRHAANKPMRRSLLELANNAEPYEAVNGLTVRDEPRLYCRHFRHERLTAIARYFGESMVATSLEETNAAFDRYREKHAGVRMEEAIKRLYQDCG